MRYSRTITGVIVAAAMPLAAAGGLQEPGTRGVPAGPTYATPQARTVIERMLRAHGGLQRWRRATTLRYDNIFFNPAEADGNPWWVSRETFHQPTRRTYHDWPLDSASLAFDGEQVWSLGWKQRNPPKFQALFFYYFVNVPWLTQDTNAVIGPAGEASLPDRDATFDTVRVTWRAPYPAGRTPHDFLVLYVERDTGLLRAYQYGNGYGTMLDLMDLPPDRKVFGPLLRIQDAFTTVDGLVFPARMHTGPLDGSRVYGHHVLFNYSLADPWDPTRLERPPGAVIDRSSTTRRGARSP